MTRRRLTKEARLEALVQAGVALTQEHGHTDWCRADVAAWCIPQCSAENVKKAVKMDDLKAMVRERMGK